MQQINIPLRVTETVYGEPALKAIMEGVKIIHDPVASTLGASGRTVIIEHPSGYPKPTKDGVTVAKSIVPFDSVERQGSEILKQASLRTAQEAGDGTTTAMVIAKAIMDLGIDVIKDKKINYTEFNSGMYRAYQEISDYLDKTSLKTTLKDVSHVATISANNDKALGDLITEAFIEAGENGSVLMEISEQPHTEIRKSEGFELESGYVNEVFVTNQEKDRVEYEGTHVLISNTKIERIEQIERFLAPCVAEGHPITIVAEMEDEVIAILGRNKIKNKFKFNLVTPTHFGVRRRDILSDLATVTGALLFDNDAGDNFDSIAKEDVEKALGFADKVVTTRRSTIFTVDETKEDVAEHISALKGRLDNEKNPTERKFLEERIAKVSSSVVTISVGASSRSEQSEIADRVDDAIHATKAALEEGIVAGGGVALHNASSYIKEPEFASNAELVGYRTVIEAIKQPLKQILENGDVQYKPSMFKKKNHGMNIKTRELGDMIEMNIIDPVKVTKSAVRNAISAASTLLSTTTIVVNLRRA